jgi:hypothetical protein
VPLDVLHCFFVHRIRTEYSESTWLGGSKPYHFHLSRLILNQAIATVFKNGNTIRWELSCTRNQQKPLGLSLSVFNNNFAVEGEAHRAETAVIRTFWSLGPEYFFINISTPINNMEKNPLGEIGVC